MADTVFDRATKIPRTRASNGEPKRRELIRIATPTKTHA
jgi:hypothetical protein